MHSPIAIISFPIILLICCGFGRRVLRLLAPEALPGYKGLLFGAAIGLGALSYLIMALGLLRALYWWAALAIVAALAAVSARDIEDLLVSAFSRARSWKISAGALVVAIPLAALGCVALIGALAPPSVNDWDTLAYHFAVPALYIKAHAIHYVPFTSHSNLPFLMEMLYTLGLLMPAAGGIALAKLFHLAVGALTALTIYAIGKKHFSPRAGVVGAVVFTAVPLIAWEATTGYIDLGAAFFITLAVFALLNHRDDGGRWGVLAAVCLGLAAATKTTALAYIPLCGIWLIWNDIRRGRGPTRALSSAAGLCLLALAIASPWYIKSYVYTGNPVYPFLYDTFAGKNWNAHLAEVYRASQMKFGMGASLDSLALAPWNLTMYAGRFFDSDVLFASIGPVFLASLPLLAAVRFGRPKLRAVLLFIAAAGIIWFYMTQQSRYLIPAIAVGAVAVGALVDELGNLRLAKALLFTSIGCAWAWTMIIAGYMAVKAAPGLVNPESYLAETLDIYPACQYINRELPREAGIILIADTRGFYLDRDYFWGDEIHHTLIPYDRFRGAADMVGFLRSKGVTHALVNFGIGPMRAPDPPKSARLVYEAIRQGLFRPEFHSEAARARSVIVFSLQASP
ncbi:MAG: glycosyltransferase family 39 protein [Armatimonadota bacterium]|nr:glycosyltransferase family 39 protein [Armatimonadota bacterium]